MQSGLKQSQSKQPLTPSKRSNNSIIKGRIEELVLSDRQKRDRCVFGILTQFIPERKIDSL